MLGKSLAARALTGSLIGASLFFVGSVLPAGAAGGDCSAIRQEQEVTGPNAYRSRGICVRLNADSKGRGHLEIPANTDSVTPWFTTLNKYYYGSWVKCWPFSCTNVYAETTNV